MKIDLKTLVIGLLVLGWHHDVKVGRFYQRKYRSTKLQRDRMEQLCRLYAKTLDEHKIPKSDFEIIVTDILTES